MKSLESGDEGDAKVTAVSQLEEEEGNLVSAPWGKTIGSQGRKGVAYDSVCESGNLGGLEPYVEGKKGKGLKGGGNE